MEAKGLVLSSTIKGPCPYAIVLFNDVKQCRTSVKNGSDSPFWGEEFQFNAIAPCRSRIRLLFFSMSPMRIQKDVEIGYVSISLGALKTGKKVEEWYPIKMFAKKTDDAPPATNMGMVRVAYLLTNDQVLPETHEKAFLDLVMDPSLACIRALGQVLTQDREALAKALMTAAITRKCDTHLVTQLLRDDLRATDDPRILFRGNTLATKALDYYMKAVGAEYLRSTLGYHIKTIYALSNSCEVDPTRLPSGKDRLMSLELIDSVKRHWKRLLGHCSSLWDAIVHAADKMPPEMLHVFHHMARETDARYPDHPDAKYAAISGFLFLRFFVAAILNPKLFNMMPEHPTEH
ncbi:Rho GTPase activation protein, partial [Caulochytrium protostelioides]